MAADGAGNHGLKWPWLARRAIPYLDPGVPQEEPPADQIATQVALGAGVPIGCGTRDDRRDRRRSVLQARPREVGLRGCTSAFDGAVDRGAADSEELGDLEGAVLAAVHQRDQVRFLFRVELGLLAAQPPFALATFMPSTVRSRIRSENSATIVRTLNRSRPSDRPLMHPRSPPGHRHVRSTLEVQHEFCGVRWPRTPRPATGLYAGERRSVSDRLRGPGTTGWLPTAPTVRKPR